MAADFRAVQTTPLASGSGPAIVILSTHYRRPQCPGDQDLKDVDGLAGNAADWKERSYADVALADTEMRMQAILNTASDAIIKIDRRGLIESVNPATKGETKTRIEGSQGTH